MVKYQRNNIIFRIASSDAIAKFKTIQTHALMQVARPDIAFDLAAREVVLIEYDRLSQWLYRMERILLAVSEGQMHETLCNAILESLREEVIVIENVLDSHVEVFDPRVTQFAKMIHRYAFDLLTSEIERRMRKSIDRAYSELTDVVSSYLQHVLLCMHEYNNNVVTHKSEPFLSYSSYFSDLIDLAHRPKNNFDPLVMRACFFVQSGCSSTFVLKNYADAEAFHEISSVLHTRGIELKAESVSESSQLTETLS